MSKPTKKNALDRFIAWLDTFQQRHSFLAFPYAVIKKYSDDEAGYQAALIAYYGFLSLFPLLIVATAVIQIVANDNAALQSQFLDNAMRYFPAMSSSLADSIHAPSKTGLALVVGLLITFYGARGVANAVQHALNHVWEVPRSKRAGFPKATIKSFGILFYAGIGFIGASALSGYAVGASHPLSLRLLFAFGGFLTLLVVFWGLFTFGSSARKRPFANIPGSLFAAIGFSILQAVGGYLIAHQLKTQSGLNAQFAVVLVMLFWLYIQAEVFLYAAEINTVRVYGLWPRSIAAKPPLRADEKAYAYYQDRRPFDLEDGRRH